MSDIQKTYSEIHQHQKNIKVLKLLHLKKKKILRDLKPSFV